MRESLQAYPARHVVPTVLYIASKVEEAPRKLTRIVGKVFEVEHQRDKSFAIPEENSTVSSFPNRPFGS